MVLLLVGVGRFCYPAWRRASGRARHGPGARCHASAPLFSRGHTSDYSYGSASLGGPPGGCQGSIGGRHADTLRGPPAGFASLTHQHRRFVSSAARGPDGRTCHFRKSVRSVQLCSLHCARVAFTGHACRARRSIPGIPATRDIHSSGSSRCSKTALPIPPAPCNSSRSGQWRHGCGIAGALTCIRQGHRCCQQGLLKFLRTFCGFCFGSGVFLRRCAGSCVRCVADHLDQLAGPRWPHEPVVSSFTRCCQLACTGAGNQPHRGAVSSKSNRQGTAIFFVWLLCFPVSTCMQLTPQGNLGRQVVFGTGPPVSQDSSGSLGDFPVRVSDSAPVPLGPASVSSSTGLMRRLCVYSLHFPASPAYVHTDVRNLGPSLIRTTCAALSLDPQAFCMLRVASPLPALPAEQYTLAPTRLPWHQALIPVDLRPVGGCIGVVATYRTVTCRELLVTAADNQGCSLPANVVCIVGSTCLMLDAQPLLLPWGDTVQAWTVSCLSRRAVSPPSGLLHANTLPLPALGAGTPHHCLWGQAVVVHSGGLIFINEEDLLPGASFGETGRAIFESDLSAAAHLFLYVPSLLQDMPEHQYFASASSEHTATGILDARNLGGSLHVYSQLVEPDAPAPFPSLDFVNALVGEPVPGRHLQELLRTGRASLERRSVATAPHEAGEAGTLHLGTLYWSDARLPLVGQDHIRPNGDAEDARAASGPHFPNRAPDSSSSTVSPGHLFGLAFSLGVILPGLSGCWRSVIALGLLAASVAAGPGDSLPIAVPADSTPPLLQQDTTAPGDSEASKAFAFIGDPLLLSIAGHRRLAPLVATQTLEQLPPIDLVVGHPPQSSSQICIQVWRPGELERFSIEAHSLARELGHRLRSLDPANRRRLPVVVYPQFAWPCLHFAAPSRDPELVTVLADAGSAVHCFDVQRHSFSVDLIRQLSDCLGHSDIRLDRGFAASIRHGEVLRVHTGWAPPSVDIGPISLLPQTDAASGWCRAGSSCYVLGPSIDLQWHEHTPSHGDFMLLGQAGSASSGLATHEVREVTGLYGGRHCLLCSPADSGLSCLLSA